MAVTRLVVAVTACVLGVSANIIVYPQDGPGLIVDEYSDEPAAFGDSLPLEGLRGFVVPGSPKDGCTALAPPPAEDNFTGKWIVLLARYDCSFEDKIRNAQSAGYDAAIVHNVNSTDLQRMSVKNAVGIWIPSVFVSNETGHDLEINYTYKSSYYIVMNREVPFDINTHLLLPFAVVVGLCLVTMIIFMIVKCIKDRRRARRHRLPNNALKKIPTCKYGKGDPYDTCAICLDDYQEGDKLRVLPCAHAYHCKCIDPWLTKNRRVCPVCKRRVFAAGERRTRRAGRRPLSSSDTDTDDSSAPLVAGDYSPTTQGGTFDPQYENPFVRADRIMARWRARFAPRPEDTPAALPASDQQAEQTNAREEDATQQLRQGEEGDQNVVEGGGEERTGVVPFLSGVLNLRNNHFGRGGDEDTEPLLPHVQSSLPSQNCGVRHENERQSESSHRRSKRRSDRRHRSTSESMPRPTSSGTADDVVVSADHSINATRTPERGEIGVAALPNTQLDRAPDHFII